MGWHAFFEFTLRFAHFGWSFYPNRDRIQKSSWRWRVLLKDPTVAVWQYWNLNSQPSNQEPITLSTTGVWCRVIGCIWMIGLWFIWNIMLLDKTLLLTWTDGETLTVYKVKAWSVCSCKTFLHCTVHPLVVKIFLWKGSLTKP